MEQLAGPGGEPGLVGLKGNVMDSKYAQMQIYAFHSQTNEHMTCPTGTQITHTHTHTYKQTNTHIKKQKCVERISEYLIVIIGRFCAKC